MTSEQKLPKRRDMLAVLTVIAGGSGVLSEDTMAQVRAVVGASKPIKQRKPKQLSRTQRWQNAASEAASALSELKDVQQEYQEWLDNLPENLQQSALGEKLSAVCDLDVESAHSTADEAESADLPVGFGRD